MYANEQPLTEVKAYKLSTVPSSVNETVSKPANEPLWLAGLRSRTWFLDTFGFGNLLNSSYWEQKLIIIIKEKTET